jgi:uncharacterized membrane protein required for colicin V production
MEEIPNLIPHTDLLAVRNLNYESLVNTVRNITSLMLVRSYFFSHSYEIIDSAVVCHSIWRNVIMSISWMDILFIITVFLLVMNGLRNGAIFSLITLVAIPLGLFVAINFGPRFTSLLAANGLPSTPLISYAVLFFGTVLILHLVAGSIRNGIKNVPLVGVGDSLLGGVIGFIEAWLLWLVLLIVLGNFLHGAQNTVQQSTQMLPGLNIHIDQLQAWHDFYNQMVNDSLFAKVNGLFVQKLPAIPHLPQ